MKFIFTKNEMFTGFPSMLPAGHLFQSPTCRSLNFERPSTTVQPPQITQKPSWRQILEAHPLLSRSPPPRENTLHRPHTFGSRSFISPIRSDFTLFPSSSGVLYCRPYSCRWQCVPLLGRDEHVSHVWNRQDRLLVAHRAQVRVAFQDVCKQQRSRV